LLAQGAQLAPAGLLLGVQHIAVMGDEPGAGMRWLLHQVQQQHHIDTRQTLAGGLLGSERRRKGGENSVMAWPAAIFFEIQ
jgi:hypothetical protein